MDLGFGNKREPWGYGSVVLSATFNGIDIGKAWSVQPTYTEDTEHAEDVVVDFVERVLFYIFLKRYPSDNTNEAALKPFVKEAAENGIKLTINKLTASPCSSRYGTCKKENMIGCAERLIWLAKIGIQITVNADHYYQPTALVANAKDLSALACQDMRKAGIVVNIANT